MHYPIAFKPGGSPVPKDADGNVQLDDTAIAETWAALEKLVDTGKVKNIGISNFSKGEVQKLLETAKIRPAVHQLETHPYLQQQAFIDWHKEQGIHVTAYSPFGNQNEFYGGTGKVGALIEHPTIAKIAKKHGVTNADIALAWGIKRGTSVIPKSVNEARIKSNLGGLQVSLDDDDMKEIATLDGPHRFSNPSEWGYKLFSDLDG